MALISVLTGIYNETFEELEASISSILTQSFTDFELILVNDNPKRAKLESFLQDQAKRDARIRLLKNSRNMGLASSMNRAANAAKGVYLARMDADDISMPDRLRLQLEHMLRTDCGLVCTCYQTIDAQGKLLSKASPFYTPARLSALLPLRNIIHHPTVMMRRDLFWQAGGYRHFPCAQDYDLWLRFLRMGVRMEMLPKPLLQYRIRPLSTTGQKRFLQALTLNYLRRCHRRSVRSGKDRHTPDSYHRYLAKYGVSSPRRAASFYRAEELIHKSHTLSGRRKYLLCLRAAAISPAHRRNFQYQLPQLLHRKEEFPHA